MRPTNLSLRGLKSWKDLNLDLEPLTAISGPNGSGKTAIIEGVKLALLGYSPEVGKQLTKTRQLVDEELGRAEVGLAFDDGFGIRRTFGEKTDAQVTPSEGEKGVTACQDRINRETGGLLVSLDLSEFFGLSDEKRRAWIFEHLPRESAELSFETFSKWTDIEASEVGDVAAAIWKHNVERAKNAVIGLGTAIDVAREKELEADRQRQAQAKAVMIADERIRQMTKPEPVDVAELADVEEAIAGMNQRIGEARAGREAVVAIEARVNRAANEVERLQREATHVEAVRAQIDADLGTLIDPKAEGILEAEAGASIEERTRIARELGEAKGRLDELVAKTAEARARGAALRAHGACPFAELGCQTDTSQILEDALDGVAAEMAALGDERVAEGLVVSRLTEELAEVDRDIILRNRRAEALARVAVKRQELEAADKSKAVRLTELRERIEIRTQELETAQAELAAVESVDHVRDLYTKREEAETALRGLQERKEARVRYDTILETQEGEKVRLDRLEARWKALRELTGNLQRLRGHVIETMIGPLSESANAILHAIDPAKEWRFVFERENRAILDFGFEEDGKLRLFDAASKGERVMLTVAFLGAILTIIDPPMKLLVIDDVEQLDPVRRRRLMVALEELSGLWDAVLLAGACDMTCDGWSVVTLESPSGFASVR